MQFKWNNFFQFWCTVFSRYIDVCFGYWVDSKTPAVQLAINLFCCISYCAWKFLKSFKSFSRNSCISLKINDVVDNITIDSRSILSDDKNAVLNLHWLVRRIIKDDMCLILYFRNRSVLDISNVVCPWRYSKSVHRF